MKKRMLVALMLIAGVAHAQEFPNAIMVCTVGKKYIEAAMGSELVDRKGHVVRGKAGMVGLQWDDGMIVWAKAQKQADGSFKVAFPGRKPMTIKKLPKPKPVDGIIYEDQVLTIQEDGGKVIKCDEEIRQH